MPPPFHHAFPVSDLVSTERFYVEVLGARAARRDTRWIDFDLQGHQLSAHQVEGHRSAAHNPVDGDQVPIPHFGLVLPWEQWHALRDRLKAMDVPCMLGPRIRFEGQPGEQATLFVQDPSGNALEFKAFRRPEQLFATE